MMNDIKDWSTTCHGKPAASVTTPEVPVTTPEPVPSVLDMQRLSSRSSSSTVASLDESLPVTTPRDHLPVLLAPLPTLHGGGCLLYPIQSLQPEVIVGNLLNPDLTKVSTVPPVKPKAGETYMIECQTFQDWTCDQYQWVQGGKNQFNIGNETLTKNYYKIKLPGTKEGKGRSRPNSSTKFKRSAYFLESNPKRILVCYEGDENVYVPLSHGNSKLKEREYVRTCKSVLDEIKETSGKPMNVYRKLVCKEVDNSHQGVLNPRNLRQVKNHQSKLRTDKTLGKDDIYNIVQLAHHLEGYVGEITVYPDLVTVLALPELIDAFQELLQSNAKSPICLVYDTNFNLGDFYVSPLVFKHVLFEETPWIPLAFLIHERKLQKCHNRLFEYMAEKVPILKSKQVPFITDREPALTKSVQLYFPNVTVLHCWNHIRKDLKEELRKQGANCSETGVYLNHWKQMSQADCLSEFDEIYERTTSQWTESVKAYFDKHIKPDILTYSGRWIIEQFPKLYDPYSGITNNPSESINSVLKRMTGWQELPVDGMLLSLYHLQNFYNAEIQRGRADIGNYHLKARYRQAKLEREDINLPNKIIEPEEIIAYVKSSQMPEPVTLKTHRPQSSKLQDHSPPNVTSASSPTVTPTVTLSHDSDANSDENSCPSSTEKETPKPSKYMSQRSMAQYVLDNDGVTHVPQCEAFVVKGNNDKKYCVTLHPEACQCPSSTTCYHIMAVKMFVGLPVDDDKKEISLRTLSKRSLKRSDKKSGRKRPRQKDLDPIVVPAPDSISSSPLAPSLTPKTPKSKKKLRFKDNSPKSDNNGTPVKLPAKKRKIIEIDQSDRWVGRLTTKHKQKIEDRNGDLCSDIMETVQHILKQQFPETNSLQQTTCAPVWSDNESRWKYAIPFNNVSSPAGQIHHTGHHHWVTSVSCNNHVYLLDSMSNGRLTTSLEIQLAALYNIGTNVLTVKIPSIQQQENSHDCGLFAIANLVQFCYGMYTGKEHVMFNTSYMRDHLVFCLERQFFVPFPRVQTKIKVNRKKPTTVLIQCDCLCRQSNSMESMVGCDWGNGTCDVWKHKTCAQRQNQEEDWFCSPHRHQ